MDHFHYLQREKDHFTFEMTVASRIPKGGAAHPKMNLKDLMKQFIDRAKSELGKDFVPQFKQINIHEDDANEITNFLTCCQHYLQSPLGVATVSRKNYTCISTDVDKHPGHRQLVFFSDRPHIIYMEVSNVMFECDTRPPRARPVIRA